MQIRRALLAVAAVVLIGSAGRTAEKPETIRGAGIVLKWVRADKEANFRRIEPMIREAARNGAQLVVTTECFLDGYAFDDPSIPLAEYRALGEPIPDGPYFKRLAATRSRAPDLSRCWNARGGGDGSLQHGRLHRPRWSFDRQVP